MSFYKNLLPYADVYVKNNFNVLLISDHGIGKTAVAVEIAKAHNLKLKYYSCATMDPFTDLVGVPFPKEGPTGTELQMVRPREVDEAELVVFDELNRADPRVQNAVFEMVQFGTINGTPLPKLRMVWAAINPGSSDQEYDVDELDPALIDRFDVYETLKPKPSVEYLATKMDPAVAKALVSWYKDHNVKARGTESYVSPRRLEKIGNVVTLSGSPHLVPRLLPPGGTYDTGKLVDLLTFALDPDTKILFKKEWIKDNPQLVTDYLNSPDIDFDGQVKVALLLAKLPTSKLATKDFVTVLNLLPRSIWEAQFSTDFATDLYYVLKKATFTSQDKTALIKHLEGSFDLTKQKVDLTKVDRPYVRQNVDKGLVEAIEADTALANKVADVIKDGIGVENFLLSYMPAAEALPEKILRKMISHWGPAKKSQFRSAFRYGTVRLGYRKVNGNLDYQREYPRFAKVLGV